MSLFGLSECNFAGAILQVLVVVVVEATVPAECLIDTHDNSSRSLR